MTSEEQHLATLLAATEDRDWPTIAREEPSRLPYYLAARFEYNVRKGGFAQLLYNMKGHLLAQIEDMLIAAHAPVAQEFYVRAVETCLSDKTEYRRFISSDYIADNAVKNKLHVVSLDYHAKQIPFIVEALPFFSADLRNQDR